MWLGAVVNRIQHVIVKIADKLEIKPRPNVKIDVDFAHVGPSMTLCRVSLVIL